VRDITRRITVQADLGKRPYLKNNLKQKGLEYVSSGRELPRKCKALSSMHNG
jgi:hypothetical protein